MKSRTDSRRARSTRHGGGGGIVPDFSDMQSGPKPDHHTAALCKVVQRAVALTLAGECGDPILQNLLVDTVVPAPSAGRLLVTVYTRDAHASLVDILPRLEAVKGLLRMRVGEASVRKRVPELVFRVVPIGALMGGNT